MGGYERKIALCSFAVMAACLIAFAAAFVGLTPALAAESGSASNGLQVGTTDTVRTLPTYGNNSVNTTGTANIRTIYRFGWISGGNNTAKQATRSNLDVTNDGWADTIKVIGTKTSNSGYLSRVKVTVNGKKAFSYSNSSNRINRVVVSVVTLKNKQEFLWVNILDGKGNAVQRMYQYDSGDWYRVMSNKDVAKSRTSNQLIYDINPDGNKIIVKFNLSTTATGLTHLKYTYAWEDGELVRTSDTASDFGYATGDRGGYYQNRLTAAGSFKAYTNTSLKKAAFTVAAGKKVNIKAVRLGNKQLLYKIKVGSKTGWISCPKIKRTSKHSPYTLFRETDGKVTLNSSIPSYSKTTLYTTEALQRYNDHALYVARNEICARHGYSFSNGELRNRFKNKSWYSTRRTAMNAVESANLSLIRDIERSRGSLYAV